MLRDLRQQGSLKLLFPRDGAAGLTAVALNTAGGITGGDRFSLEATARAGTTLTMTSQAAERAYRAAGETPGVLDTRIRVSARARLNWLPQETLLFDGAALSRSLSVDLASDAACLLVEPLILGRTAMGETVSALRFTDRIDVKRDGAPVFADRTRIVGNPAEILAGAATTGGRIALAGVVYAGADAARFLGPARELMPRRGGVSLIRQDVLFARIAAVDSFELRHRLLPLIRLLSGNPLPRTWTI